MQQKGYNDVVTSNVNSVANRFMFGNKEYGQELGLDWYDISARNYDLERVNNNGLYNLINYQKNIWKP